MNALKLGQLYHLTEDDGDTIRDRERDIKLYIPEVLEAAS